MGIIIKNKYQISKIRESGRLASQVLDMLEDHVLPGVTTQYLNDICHNHITLIQKAIPSPLLYQGFPKSICTSINHVVCHGIPSDRKLKKGDIINIDVTVKKDNYHGDTSRMFLVGDNKRFSIAAKRLVSVSYLCLWKAIQIVKPGVSLFDIAKVIEDCAHLNNFSVVEAFCGHGIGESFHEDPQIIHYVPNNQADRTRLRNIKLKEGMVFTIEPMINIGSKNVTILKDGWTAITKDRSLSAQWEHTVLVTKRSFEILTLSKKEILGQ